MLRAAKSFFQFSKRIPARLPEWQAHAIVNFRPVIPSLSMLCGTPPAFTEHAFIAASVTFVEYTDRQRRSR
jgi:hypothetical protein